MQLVEIEDLRRALADQADELQRNEEANNRLGSQKTNMVQTATRLEDDLQRVRQDAESFGRDLERLRAEKVTSDAKHARDNLTAERARKQAQSQIRVLNEQLDQQNERLRKAQDEVRSQNRSGCVNTCSTYIISLIGVPATLSGLLN